MHANPSYLRDKVRSLYQMPKVIATTTDHVANNWSSSISSGIWRRVTSGTWAAVGVRGSTWTKPDAPQGSIGPTGLRDYGVISAPSTRIWTISRHFQCRSYLWSTRRWWRMRKLIASGGPLPSSVNKQHVDKFKILIVQTEKIAKAMRMKVARQTI